MGPSLEHVGSRTAFIYSFFPTFLSVTPRGGGPHFSATQDLGKYIFVGGPEVSYAVDRLYRHVPKRKNHHSRRTWPSGQAGNPKVDSLDTLTLLTLTPLPETSRAVG